MPRLTLKVQEIYVRWVAIIYLILASIGLTSVSAGITGYPFQLDFWGMSGLHDNPGLVIIYLIIGGLAALVGFLIGTPEPAYSFTLVVGPLLILIGLVGFISASYFGLLGRGAGIGDDILNLIIGAIGLYIVLTRRMRLGGVD
ncbi:MAG: hypothetical protein DLM69_06285 [Candidatus Chloroheliales bacterium]|nr:MAG: hypothetical protein DLM69_06285 [Chloroflexota bacterium]